MDASPDDLKPGPASGVGLVFDGLVDRELRMSLGDLAAVLSRRPPTATGFGSRVWRFSAASLADHLPPAPGARHFALKWVRTDDPVRRAWLPRELHWLRRLDGQGTPRPFAHGLLGDRGYLLLLEWIEGRNLALDGPSAVRELIEAGRFDPFCADLLATREHLRRAGIVHGDIQEANVVVRDLRPVLIDFGWARPAGTPPARDNMHEPDDDRALIQLLLRLGSLRRLLLPLVARDAGRGESL